MLSPVTLCQPNSCIPCSSEPSPAIEASDQAPAGRVFHADSGGRGQLATSSSSMLETKAYLIFAFFAMIRKVVLIFFKCTNTF